MEFNHCIVVTYTGLLSRGRAKSSGLTWYAAFLGYPILGLWYWCSDQTIVQQVLAAKTKDDAQKGPVFAGFLKLITPFIMIVPGIIGYILFKQEIFDVAQSAIPAVTKPGDMALSVLIDQLLPVGLQGLFAAALMSALMSTIAAALNSISTLVSVDIYKRIKPETYQHERKLRLSELYWGLHFDRHVEPADQHFG